MSRKPSVKGESSKALSFNQLISQLEDPRSMLSLMTEDLRMNALNIPDQWLNLDEDAILQKLKIEKNYTPTNTVECLRSNFWMEFERVVGQKGKREIMNNSNIYLGVCSREYWFKVVTSEPHIFAYILTSSPTYEIAMTGLLKLATRRIRDVLSIPIDPDGDPKIVELVLKAAAMVDLRNKGGYINRSETKNLTMMQNKTEHSYSHMFTAASSKAKDAADTLLDIDEKLKALEAEIKGTPEPVVMPSPAVVVTTEVVETIDAEYTEVSKRG